MWSITSYYNPMRYKRRLANYQAFRKNLATPLVTAELSFDGSFELTKDDADILIQISGGAVLWQKERLLNLAFRSVPLHVQNIAWLDCDVIFDRPDWEEEANAQLNDFNVIQLFSDVLRLNQNDYPMRTAHQNAPPSVRGLVSFVNLTSTDVAGLLDRTDRTVQPRSTAGYAWAARREILQNHGLYDAMIAGGGDRASASAMYGQFDGLIKLYNFNKARQEHYLDWARPYHRAVDQRIGHVAGRLYHLWHGDIENRDYEGRHRRVAECNFNPGTDIAVGANGAWQWARSRPKLEEFLVNYFMNRAEDG